MQPGPCALELHYCVTGNIRNLHLPPKGDIKRSDDLWQHTCFEAFIRPANAEIYYEFNFAPSREWAAYQFSSYRSAMRIADEISAPHMKSTTDLDKYQLQVALDLAFLPDAFKNRECSLAASAVIEEASGQKSYWALAHPPGKPDFHHDDGFVQELTKLK